MFVWLSLLILPFTFLLGDFSRNQETPLLQEEIERLSYLITASEETLERLKTLRKLMVDYQEKLSYYLDHGQEKEAALRVAKVAVKILDEIKENHLTDLFDSEFLSELTLFSQLGQKKGLVKPSSL